jgi:hypothetical protein
MSKSSDGTAGTTGSVSGGAAKSPSAIVGVTFPEDSGVLSWEKLSHFRTANILRMGYVIAFLVPPVSYVIITYNHIFPAHGVQLPKSMFLVFLGSLALAAAHLINQIACPNLIKTYGSLFVLSQSLARFAQEQAVIENAALQATKRTVSRAIRKSQNSLDDADVAALTQAVVEVADELEEEAKEARPIDAYAAYWRKANTSLLAVRIVIALLYGTAAAIALWETTSQLNTVLEASLGRGLVG